jgi:O-antigen/teichoic acid export membrane protein
MSAPKESVQSSADSPRGMGRFLRFSLIYGVGDLLTKGARIILLPFYMKFLPQSEVGELFVLLSISFISWTLLGFGLHFAVQKFYVDYKEDGDALASSLWLSRWIGGLPFYGLTLLLGWGFYHISDQTIPLYLILVAITAGYLRGGINLVEFWLNIREQPISYRAFTFGQFLLTTSLIIFLVVGLQWGVAGVVFGELISYSCFLVFSGIVLFRRAMPRLSIVNWKEIFGYCLPVLPHAFFMGGMMAADRLILNQFVPKSEIAIYSTGFLLGTSLSIVVQSMRSAWLPAYFRNAKSADSHTQFGKIASIYFVATFFTALCGIFFAPEIVSIFSAFTSVSYTQSARVMQFILLGFVSMAVFLAVNQPLFYQRKTGVLSMISGTGLLVNVGVNFALIPIIGIWGAVVANIAAYSVMAVATLVVTKKIYNIDWETQAMLQSAAVFLAFAVAAWCLPAETVVWLIPIKMIAIVAFVALVLFRVKLSSGSFIKLESRFAWSRFWAGKSSFRTLT